MGTTKKNLNLVKGLRAKGLDIKRLFPRKFEVEGQKHLMCRHFFNVTQPFVGVVYEGEYPPPLLHCGTLWPPGKCPEKCISGHVL